MKLTRRTLGNGATCVAVLALSAPAVACNRAASEPKQGAQGAAIHAMSEKIAETVLEKEGAKNAKIDVSKNGSSISITDEDGKQVAAAGGNAAHLSESDLGIPFYPGATLDESKSVRIDSAREFQRSAMLTSSDGFDKVASFYRDKLKAVTGSRRYAEIAEGTGKIEFVLADERGAGMTMVTIEAPPDAATAITLLNAGKRATATPAK